VFSAWQNRFKQSLSLGSFTMNDDFLLVVHDRIATLRFNRPASLNSLSLASIQSLLQHLRDLSQRKDVRALVLTGQGRGFCAGWQLDMDQVPGIEGESLGVRQSHLMAEYFNPVIEALHDCPFPTLAAVNGVCAGAGVSLALACDVVIAHHSAAKTEGKRSTGPTAAGNIKDRDGGGGEGEWESANATTPSGTWAIFANSSSRVIVDKLATQGVAPTLAGDMTPPLLPGPPAPAAPHPARRHRRA
jgi:hypothetical protein